MTPRAAAPVAALVAVAVSLPMGGRVFGSAVVLLAAVALLGFATAFAAAGPRPVLAGAGVAGLGIPLRLVLTPQDQFEPVPALLSAMVLVAFGLLIVSGRRSDITTALGATAVCGLVVGLGAGGLILLRSVQHGFRWALAVVVLTLIPEVAAALAPRVRPGITGVAQAARVVLIAAITGGLLAAANPPMTPAAGIATAVICAAAAYAAAQLEQAVAAEAPASRAGDVAGIRWFGGLLLAAPAVYLVATVMQS